jgi:hypothetical protein
MMTTGFRGRRIGLGSVAVALLAGCADDEPASPPTAPGLCAGAQAVELEALYQAFERDVMPLLARPPAEGGCVSCHGPATTQTVVIWPDARRTMDELWANGFLSAAGEPGTLLGVLRDGAPKRMPLGGQAWPAEEVAALEGFTCAVLASGLEPPAMCAGDPDPGNQLIRRLSNYEYGRTMGELTGAPTPPTGDLPNDFLAQGFDNVASAQQFSASHFEQYENVARAIAADTLLVPAAIGHDYQAEGLGAYSVYGSEYGPQWGGVIDNDAEPHRFHFALMAGYVTTGLIELPYDGTYKVTVHARGKNADYWIHDVTAPIDPPQLAAQNVKPLLKVSIGGAEFGAGDVAGTDAPYAWGAWDEYEFTGSLPAGMITVRAGLDNVAWGSVHQRPVELDIDWIEISGPLPSELPEPDLDRIARFIVCDEAEPGCADAVISNALGLAWRRPPTAEEIARYGTLISLAAEEGDTFSDGVELVLEAAFSSPNFLFRPEVDPDPEVIESRPLDGYELATRLSYFLWSSTPDAELLARAADGSLIGDEALAIELERMLDDPRASAITDNFAGQWLQLRQMQDMSPSVAEFPEWDEGLRQAMIAEVRELFREFLREDLDLLDILDTDFTYVNQRLADHYGIPFSGGSTMTRIDTAGLDRGGLIESAGFLTLTSFSARTSPTRRGKWILDQLLCQPPEDPPPGIDTNPQPPPGGASRKEIMRQHAENPACAGCHLTMDAMGFTLESFGPLGSWREVDDFDMEVDASSELPDGTVVDGHRGMIEYLRDNPALETCMTKKMLVYALGRDPEVVDSCTLGAVVDEFAASGHTVRGLVKAIVMSPLFRQRRPERPGEYDYLNGEEE